MSYTLAAAAKATGLKKARILKAIEDGRIAGWKTERGEWRIDDADLHRIFPRLAPVDASDDDSDPQADILDAEALGAQIEALLRKAGRRLRQQLEDVRLGADTEDDGAELLPDTEYEWATGKSKV